MEEGRGFDPTKKDTDSSRSGANVKEVRVDIIEEAAERKRGEDE